MCYGDQRLPSRGDFTDPNRIRTRSRHAAVQNLREQLAEVDARLEQARVREAELTRQLEEMKKFVCVMEILESYIERQYRENQLQLAQLYASFH